MINVQKVRTFSIGALLLFVSMAVFVPFYPFFPSAGLDVDSSWTFTMNEAIAKGWIFGKEIIFTFGPYASVYSKTYHPATDQLMFFSSLFLSICYGLLLSLLTKSMKFYWIFAYALFVLGCPFTPDPLMFSYPLILFLVIYRFPVGQLSGFTRWAFPLFFSPLALLPLIKGSYLPICGAVAVLSFILLWKNKQRALAYSAILTPLVAGPIFWLISGQPLYAFPLYFINMSSIISGYAEAMSIQGYPREIILYIITAISILWAVSKNKSESTSHKICLFSCFALFLFIVFKAGYIRQDGHPSCVSAPFLVIVVLLLNTIKTEEKFLTIAIVLAIVTWTYTDANFFKTSTKSALEKINGHCTNVGKGLKKRLSSKDVLTTQYFEHLKAIQTKIPIPKLIGSTDIYSYQQSALLSSDNTFSVRPVFQSYSAYTPKLAQCNENYLRSKNAPDNIFFRVEPIDGRLPSLEDGLSWPTLINNYSAEKHENNFVLLKKKNTNNDITETEIYKNTHRMGKEVFLPETEKHLYAEIELAQTIFGKIRSFLFKPTPLYIKVNFSNGSSSTYRFISSMAKSRFLLSPLVENTSDFLSLTQLDSDSLSNKLVKSIRINGDSTYWNKHYTIKLSTIDYSKQFIRNRIGESYVENR